MIDVSNSEAVEWNRRSDERPPYPGQTQDPAQDEGEDDIDEEEAMWLRSLQEEDLTTVKGVQSGAGLVMDPGDLRQTSNRSRKG